jgi:hypothetical protein
MDFIFLVDKCTPNDDIVSVRLYIHIYLRNNRKCFIEILFSVSLLRFVERIDSFCLAAIPDPTSNELQLNCYVFCKIHCQKTGYVIQYVSLRPARYCEPCLEVVGIERNIKIRRPNEDVFVKLDSYLL